MVAVDGVALRDSIDFMYEAGNDVVEVEIRRNGVPLHHVMERTPGESLGLELADDALEQIITCNNKCPFCFLKGLKPGMRKPLYVKDDDFRLSFLHGNFITLTNLTEEDWQRLETQKLSPLYVSVHATDPELRHRMLGNTRSRPIADDINRIRAAGIEIHTQVVVLPGINDGVHLNRSIEDLAREHPTVASISVVPVGVTRFNLGGEDGALRPQTKREARDLIAQIKPFQTRFRRHLGIDFVYLSDEVYLRAERPPPKGYRYDGYAQYENGVGMVRWLIDDTARFLRRFPAGGPAKMAARPGNQTRAVIVCGTLAAPRLVQLAAEFAGATGIELDVRPVVNNFWGHTVSVSGLLAGHDIAEQLAGQAPVDVVFLSTKCLDASRSVLIDDWTLDQLSRSLGARVAVVESFAQIFEDLAGEPGRIEAGSCAAS